MLEGSPEINAYTPVIMIDVPECTLTEYARRCGRPLNTIKRLCNDGQIPVIKYGKEKQDTAMVNLMKIAERNLANEW